MTRPILSVGKAPFRRGFRNFRQGGGGGGVPTFRKILKKKNKTKQNKNRGREGASVSTLH